MSLWWISRHAVERWTARFSPTTVYRDAVDELIAISRHAQVIPCADRGDGRVEYAHPDHPLARFVVGPPRAEGMLPTLVTVLDAPTLAPSRVRSRTKGLTRSQTQRWFRRDAR